MQKEIYAAARPCSVRSNMESGRERVPQESQGKPSFVVRPATRWEILDLRELWSYRQVFSAFMRRNMVRRHRQTLLGPFWFVISPVVRMLLFSVALGKVAGLPSEGIPYPIFTFTALLPWELFSSGVLLSSESLVTYEHIISKVYFPRILVPATEVFGTLVDFGISLVILLLMTVGYGFPLTSRLVFVPAFVVLAMAQSFGVGLLFSGLHARYRDVSKLLAYLLQFWFYATPVAYSKMVIANRLPAPLVTIYRLNPMYQVVEGMRWAILPKVSAPEIDFVIAASLITFVILLAGAAVFAKTEHSIVDMI